MPTDSIIDQRRLMQARIDALFAGKISTEAFLRTRKLGDDRHDASDLRPASGASGTPALEVFGS